MAAARTRHRAQLHDPVRVPEDVRVVVHHHHRVAIGQKVAHDVQKPVDVRGVQADGRLVQHVEHAGRAVAHGAGQLHALALARGERGARAVEREVGQPQIHEARGRVQKRLADALGHRPHLSRKPCGHALHPAHKLAERLLGGRGQVDARHLGLARVFGQARAAAQRAGALFQEPGHAREPFLVLHLRKRVLYGAHGVVIGEVELGERVGLLRLIEDVPLLGGAVEHDVALFRRKLVEGHVGAHAHLASDLLHEVPHERSPRRDGSFVDSERLVGHERRAVHRTHDAGAVAFGARSVAVEGQLLRARPVELRFAHGADDGDLGRHGERGRHAVAVWAHVAAYAREQEA